MATPFKPVNWQADEVLDTDKMQQMAANDRALLEMMPRALYGAYGVAKTSGVKIAAGVRGISPNRHKYNNANVQFPAFFTPGSRPVVVISIVTQMGAIHDVIRGYGGQGHPDHRGFSVNVRTDSGVFTGNLWVTWIAVGY